VAHHPFQAFQQCRIGRALAVAELVQAPQVIGDAGLFADEVVAGFRQGGQVRGKQPVGVVPLQLPAGVAGQRADAVVQRGRGRTRSGPGGPIVQRCAPASAASRALSR
jgi:hypothetical protein